MRAHRLADAEYCASPNQNERPEGQPVDLLVLHNISLPPGRFGTPYIRQFFQNRLDVDADPYFQEIRDLQVSAHLLIDRSGKVIQFVDFDRRAWHAGDSSHCGRQGCNDFSIGIELEGTDDIPFTDGQYRKLASVCAELMLRYPNITVDNIVGHSDVAPGRKTDPGPAFDWSRFRLLLAELT